jgi:hypothetical protein
MDNESPAIGSIPQTPELNESLEGTQPAIRDNMHAREILKGMFDANDERVKLAAKIRSKADGIDPPLSSAKLAEEGKKHKRNYSTGFLGTIIQRIVPRLVMRVKATPYLTAAKFPVDKVANSDLKTEVFRSVVTDTIRKWEGWHFFLYELADNNVKFGKAFVAYDDEMDWRPNVERIDDAVVPNGAKQGMTPDYFGIRREYSVSEAYEYIANEELAREAGWDIENMRMAINKAKPIREDDEQPTEERAIDVQDVELESIKPENFTIDWNAIKMEILYAKEYDGRVSMMVIEGDSGDELFYQEGMYNSMKDVVQPVCYDIGNGKIYGSMGAGDMLYDMALNIEKSRNKAQDQLDNRGKFILTVKDATDLNTVKTHVTDEYIYVAGATVIGGNNSLPDNAEAFITTDRYLRGLAEEKVGAFTPDSMASDKTATQSQIDALKEAETRDAKLDYWLTYIGHIIAMMVRRMMDPTTLDREAQLAQARCLEVMNRQELMLLAMQPPATTGLDWTDLDRNKKITFLSSKLGNPAWNQYWLERTISILTVGKEMTDQGLLPEGDQTQMIEATRQQQDESFTMSATGTPVLVSPRDEHVIHMQSLSGERDPATQMWTGQLYSMIAEGNTNGAAAALEHYQQHYMMATQQELLGEYENVAKAFMSDARKSIEQTMQAVAAATGAGPIQ